MRVLHLYSGNLFGGIERVLLTLRAHGRGAAGLVRAEFALAFDAVLAERLRADGAEVHILGNVRARLPWTIARARLRLRQLLARRAFDAVVAHSCWAHAMFAPTVRRVGLPLLLWLHDVPSGRGWIERRARRIKPDLVLANSRFTASRAVRLFADTPCDVQYPPIAPAPLLDRDSARREIRAALGTPADAVVILQMSRTQRGKGHRVLLDALTQIRTRSPWECWIGGAPQRAAETRYLAELRSLADSLGARVRFIGQCDDVPRVLAAADVLCQPNTEPEGFGMIFVEALRSGLPVITSDIGAAREIVDSTSGRLVPANDRTALAAQIETLIDDSDLRRRLSTAGLQLVAERFDIDSTIASLHRRLASVAAEPAEVRA